MTGPNDPAIRDIRYARARCRCLGFNLCSEVCELKRGWWSGSLIAFGLFNLETAVDDLFSPR